MKLIGRSSSGEKYLLGPDDMSREEPPPIDTPARILDLNAGTLSPPMPLHSITAHMPYLESYEGDDGELAELLTGVEARGPPKTKMGELTEYWPSFNI